MPANTQELSARTRRWHRSRILNAWVDSLAVEEIVDELDEGMLFTLNPDHLYHLQRNPDFAANPAVSIFLLGAKPGIAEMARARINHLAGREIVVGALGPSFNFVHDEQETADAIAMVNASSATCLIVGLGAPKQEIWIDRHRSRMPGVKVYMGVGATIDYEADAVRRAPPWMTRNGLEWVYRMTTEPRRYWRRYTRTLEFFWLVLLDRFGLYRPPSFTSPVVDADASTRSAAINGSRRGTHSLWRQSVLRDQSLL